jgi:hypothetical protein
MSIPRTKQQFWVEAYLQTQKAYWERGGDNETSASYFARRVANEALDDYRKEFGELELEEV